MRRTLFGLPIFLALFLLIPAEVSGEELDLAGIEDKIDSIAHYAEEYETGNINYLQLNVYGFKIRSDLNLLLGGGIGENWARIPKESVEKAFGTPADYTNWVWVDNRQENRRLDEALPWWERIVFDGRKIQIVFNAFPSAIEGEDGTLFKYYSVDLNVRFKKKFDFDINEIFLEIGSLASDYNQSRTRKDGETFVTKMLEDESLLRSYVQENMEQCTDIMEGFFTPEEKLPNQKTMTWRFSLYKGSDFDVIAQTDMCEECEWHHLSIWFSVEGRGPMFIFKSPELNYGKLDQQFDEEYYQTLTADEINQEFNKTIFEMRDEAEKFDKTRSEDFPKKFYFAKFKVEQLSRILDGKYNGVEGLGEDILRKMAGKPGSPGGCKSPDECRRYCQNRENVDECRKFTYGLRVESLERMFSGYRIEKTPADQLWWERRLFENLVTTQNSWCRHVNDLQCRDDEGCVDGECVLALGGNETCSNRADDDGDNLADCQDPDCWQERQCGKLCEDVCNREGGCWQTSQELCSAVCKECWDCGGDENCKAVCEPECWPCHNQEEVKSACDDCWTCEDEAYGGCYTECKPCEKCNTQRNEKIKAIFSRVAAGEIQTPGGCMTEDDCNRYCAQQKEAVCWESLDSTGLRSPELDCSGECKDCSVCNYDLGNFKCNENQNFDRENGYCVCDKGWYDCEGDWSNGCETKIPCGAGPCLEECKECDECGEGESCEALCVKCRKCRNPDMPTYICDGVEQLEPCETEYLCNGVKQKKPCAIYICNGREYAKPCDEINITCGKNQILEGNECGCREGFRDCDNDGNCESTKSCGLEICDNGKDDNNDGSVDCQDVKCSRQVCGIENGKELLCIGRSCMPPEEEVIPGGPEPVCGNHICELGEIESCPEDCFVCEVHEPPECPNGKIVWKGKDSLGCLLPPICVVTEKICESDKDCPQPKCGISQCADGECKVTELTTDCEEGCKDGKTRKRECKDKSEITTAVCIADQWVETGYDCPEVSEAPIAPPEGPPEGQPEVPPGEPEAQPEEEIPEEEIPEEAPQEEAAPEIEEEAPEACEDCVLANDCGGTQDVCSNGNCVTLPLPVEEEKKDEKGPPEAPPGKPETPPEAPSEPETPPEAPPEAPPELPPEPPPETPPAESPPTGSMISDFVSSVSDWLTGMAGGEETCSEECSPCEECNRKLDSLLKRMGSEGIAGPNGCNNRVQCDEYCYREEHREECQSFFRSHGIETYYCWQEFCRECDKCRFKIGEFQCNANQNFSMDEGFCQCNKGWYDCDGDWENGCESPQMCGGCQAKEDCAQDRCAPWGNVIQQFDCFKGEEWVEVRGAVRVIGMCRFYSTKKAEGGVSFDMWGEPFEEAYPIKEEVQREKGEQWCGWDLENNIRERTEIQNSLTEDFLKWFFEEYVPSSPSEWEKHIGGIYDSYWRIVNNNQRAAEDLLCLGRDKLPEEYKPIDVSYDTDFGSVRIWEVETTTDYFGKRMRILSPYMQIWVFPPKEFIKKQFQEAMESGTMPGPEGGKPELSPSEIEEAKKDKGFMDMINSLSDRYGGEAKLIFNVVDKNETVFNALITINPEILVKFEPTKTYEGDYDSKLTMDFDFFYSLIKTSEKEMRGGQTEYPPWEKEGFKIGDVIKGAVDGIRMWFMINSGVMGGSIRADPPGSLEDGLNIMRLMFERGSQG